MKLPDFDYERSDVEQFFTCGLKMIEDDKGTGGLKCHKHHHAPRDQIIRFDNIMSTVALVANIGTTSISACSGEYEKYQAPTPYSI